MDEELSIGSTPLYVQESQFDDNSSGWDYQPHSLGLLTQFSQEQINNCQIYGSVDGSTVLIEVGPDAYTLIDGQLNRLTFPGPITKCLAVQGGWVIACGNQLLFATSTTSIIASSVSQCAAIASVSASQVLVLWQHGSIQLVEYDAVHAKTSTPVTINLPQERLKAETGVYTAMAVSGHYILVGTATGALMFIKYITRDGGLTLYPEQSAAPTRVDLPVFLCSPMSSVGKQLRFFTIDINGGVTFVTYDPATRAVGTRQGSLLESTEIRVRSDGALLLVSTQRRTQVFAVYATSLGQKLSLPGVLASDVTPAGVFYLSPQRSVVLARLRQS